MSFQLNRFIEAVWRELVVRPARIIITIQICLNGTGGFRAK